MAVAAVAANPGSPMTESAPKRNAINPAIAPVALKFFFVARFKPMEHQADARKTNERKADQKRRRVQADESRNAAEQARNRMGAKTCCALAFALVPRAPSAFKPDQEPDGERHGEACQRLFRGEEHFQVRHGLSVIASDA